MNRQQLGSNILQRINSFSIAALIFGAAILFYACESNDIEQIKAFTSPDNLPVIEASDFETLVTDSGEVRYHVTAPKLLKYETDKGEDYLEFPEGVELVKYDENQQIISSITADYAKQFLKEKKWEAKNHVVATNASGDTLKTEHLIYEEEKEKIYTDEFVKIIRPDRVITGIGFESDQSLGNWKINQIQGDLYITAEPQKQDSSSISPAQPDSIKQVVKKPDNDDLLEFK